MAYTVEDARKFARANMQLVTPSQDHWFASAHVLELARIIPILVKNSDYKDGEFCVLAGVKGTAIERIHKALADRIISGQAVPGYTRVKWLDLASVLGQADIHGIDESYPAMVLQEAFEMAKSESPYDRAVLVIDNAQVLDSLAAASSGQSVEGGALSEFRGVGAALVVMLFHEREPGAADQSRIVKLEHAHKVVAEPYSVAKTHAAIFPTFAAKWSKERECVPEEDAFDTLFTLEPWIYEKGARTTLPYLAIFEGKNASVLLNLEAANETMRALAAAARETLDKLERDADPGVADYFSAVFAQMRSDLDAIIDEKRPRRKTPDGKTIMTRGDVMASLLGRSECQLILPATRPSHPEVLVNPRLSDSVLPPAVRTHGHASDETSGSEKGEGPSSQNGTGRVQKTGKSPSEM